jgi:tRNA dimethylallyltransferase
MPNPAAILIAGPTASGKSALALALAERHGGTVINADSMQVYRDLRIITARPTPEEEARAPHRLYGHVDAAENYSVGRWCVDAAAALAEAEGRGRLPILVGGTGLYFKALTQGLAEAPAADKETRARLKTELERDGAGALHARLELRDSEAAARIEPADSARLLRALEVAESGVKLSELQKLAKPALKDWAGLALWPGREALYRATDARFEAMMAAGALDEARLVAARGLDAGLPAMKAHGAPWLMAHLNSEMGLDRAARLAQRDTRHYCKRQFTWIAHQMADWPRCVETGLEARAAFASQVLRDGAMG